MLVAPDARTATAARGVLRAAGTAARRHPHLTLAALVVAMAVPYAVLGVGWVLDDWFTLRNAHFEGALAAAGRGQTLYRPGLGFVYFVVFGLIGQHPLAVYALQVALAALTAVLFFRVLRRVVDERTAFAAAALWAVLPNHASLVNWASCAGIALAVVLLLTASLLLISPQPRGATEAGAALLLTASVLTYEATAPAALAAAVLLPRLAGGGWRWRQAALCVGGLLAAGTWMLTHLDPAKAAVRAEANLAQLLPAHFGWGVAPGALAPLVALLALGGLTVTLLDVTRFRGRRVSPDDRLVLAGLCVIAVGTLPFVRYHFAPLGAGDRVNLVAAFGTALAWVGFARMAWRGTPRLVAGAATAVVVVAMGAAGAAGAMAWHEAAASGRRVVAALPAVAPGGEIVVGPQPLMVRNVAAFLDDSNIDAAFQLRVGDRRARARMSHAASDFASVPAHLRVDLRCIPGTVEAARATCPG